MNRDPPREWWCSGFVLEDLFYDKKSLFFALFFFFFFWMFKSRLGQSLSLSDTQNQPPAVFKILILQDLRMLTNICVPYR